MQRRLRTLHWIRLIEDRNRRGGESGGTAAGREGGSDCWRGLLFGRGRQSYTSAAHVSLAICQGQRDQDGSPPNAASCTLYHSLWHSSLCISLPLKDHSRSLPVKWHGLHFSVSRPQLALPSRFYNNLSVFHRIFTSLHYSEATVHTPITGDKTITSLLLLG